MRPTEEEKRAKLQGRDRQTDRVKADRTRGSGWMTVKVKE